MLLAFAAWRWAEGPRPSPGIRSRASLVLALASVLLAVSYAGLDRRLRADLAVYTGGSGSNEDIIAFVRVSREMVFPPPPE